MILSFVLSAEFWDSEQLIGRVSSMPLILRARTEEDGRRRAQQELCTQYPASDGWTRHACSMVRIPDDWIAHPDPE